MKVNACHASLYPQLLTGARQPAQHWSERAGHPQQEGELCAQPAGPEVGGIHSCTCCFGACCVSLYFLQSEELNERIAVKHEIAILSSMLLSHLLLSATPLCLVLRRKILPDINAAAVAPILLGARCYVNWPHLQARGSMLLSGMAVCQQQLVMHLLEISQCLLHIECLKWAFAPH
eukprot:1159358-Pelagomonas_calceolata.AAC.7